MKYLNIAVRNLNRQKKRTLLIGGAIAFGILVITLSNTFVAGMVVNVKEAIAELRGGHIFISEKKRRDDGEIIEAFVDEETVVSVLNTMGFGEDDLLRRSELFGNMIFSGTRTFQAVSGVDWASETVLKNRIGFESGSLEDVLADPNAILIPHDVAENLSVQVGDEITVQTETVTGQDNVGTFTVRGIMVSSGILSGLFNYAHRERVNELINISADTYQTIHVRLPSLDVTPWVSGELYRALEEQGRLAPELRENSLFGVGNGQRVRNDTPTAEKEKAEWEKGLYRLDDVISDTAAFDQILSVINISSVVFLLILIFIIMVGVANTFRMIMLERVREIGTMRAIGVQRGAIGRIFLWEAFGIGTIGYLLGILLAVIASFFLRLINVPVENTFNLFTLNGRFTFPFAFSSLVVNYVLVTVFTVIAASSPARKASKSSPAEALRN